jgi:type IV secretory pathway TraG/TraD family ATPase VirD4
MNPLLAIALALSVALSYFCYGHLDSPWNLIAPPALVAATVLALRERRRGIRIGGMNWTESELCQHFFISGATGSAKTQSAINTLAATFLASFPRCSTIFLDVKGVVHRDVAGLAKWARREADHILLRSRSHEDSPAWRPAHTINLTGNPNITSATYAKLIADTYTSLNKSTTGDPFWPTAAQLIIQHCLDALRLTDAPVTIPQVATLIKSAEARTAIITSLSKSSNQEAKNIAQELTHDFEKPEETLGSIIAHADNYLAPFLNPWISEVFCAARPTFDFDQLDKGKLVCISIPPTFQAERIYINTFIKFGTYMHLQMRFQHIQQIDEKNLIFVFADEGQEIVTAADSAFADHRQLAVIREAKGCFVLATQTYEALATALGKDRANVLVSNLLTHFIFKAATKETSEWAATSIGDRTIREKSLSYHRGRRTLSYRPIDEAIIKPHKLRKLPKFTAVVVHPSGRHRKIFLPPISSQTGRIAPWFFSRFGYLAFLHPFAVFVRKLPRVHAHE